MKVLVATDKPFAKAAVDGIRKIVEGAGHELALLEKYTAAEELYAAVNDVDAIIIRSDKITKEVVEKAPKLKIVVRAGAGYDNIDLAACTEKGIVAMNTPGQNSNAVAELAIGMMIFMSRNCFTPGTGSELKGKTVGIHAFGNVGRLVAPLAKGFGMSVMIFDPFVTPDKVGDTEIKIASSVEELYSSCH
jgi:D-3-phosphoglycerate dehydrogenase